MCWHIVGGSEKNEQNPWEEIEAAHGVCGETAADCG